MARILLTWELGGGLGHLMSLRPLALGFVTRGHQVFLATRDLAPVRRIFGVEKITMLPAPWTNRATQTIHPVATYADLLLNIGYSDEDSLASHVDAWRNLIALVNPDLMICDHSPTALFAARGLRLPVATAGTGFFIPIDESPLRLMRDLPSEFRTASVTREEYLLKILNRSLVARSQPQMKRVTQLFHNDEVRHFLMTFRELDHFVGRDNVRYWGTWPYGLSGQPFQRPSGKRCIFAYLKPFPTLGDFLTRLRSSEIGAVIFIDGWSDSEKAKYQSNHVHFPTSPINIREAANCCDLALTNATHGTCAAMLFAKKPLINVPLFLEQAVFAAATDRLGASVTVQPSDGLGVMQAIERVLAEPKYYRAAESFADRYRDARLDNLTELMIDEMESMIPLTT